MRWLIVGANGMLGHDLAQELQSENLITLSRSQCDISKLNEVKSNVHDVDVVINCAAYTAVDAAESNRELAFKINAQGPKNLAIVCNDIGAKLVHYSTDYVFSGDANQPYKEDDIPNPKSIYGESKLAGEIEIKETIPDNYYLIRTAWLYGKHGNHFGKTILNLAKNKEFLEVVDDQIGQPTWTKDLAQKTIELVTKSAPPGTYHGTSEGQVSWFEYARKIFELAGIEKERVKPVSSELFPRPAPRPHFSVLAHNSFERAGIPPIRNWEKALKDAFSERVFYD